MASESEVIGATAAASTEVNVSRALTLSLLSLNIDYFYLLDIARSQVCCWRCCWQLFREAESDIPAFFVVAVL